jgi:hypothetical protein
VLRRRLNVAELAAQQYRDQLTALHRRFRVPIVQSVVGPR